MNNLLVWYLPSVLEKIHIFFDEHKLKYGLKGRFDPDIGIANAWKNLESGTFGAADLKIFKHEHFEARFEGIFKTDYNAAHEAANRAGRTSGLSKGEEAIYGNKSHRNRKNFRNRSCS